MMTKEAVAKRLLIARKLRDYSRSTVAKRLKYDTDGAVQHHESGRSLPDAFVLAEYAKLYDVSLDWIVTGRGRGPTDSPDPYAKLIRAWDDLDEEGREHLLDVAEATIKRKRAKTV